MHYWFVLLSALTGGLSIFSLAHKFLNFGLAPLMRQFLDYYRVLLHPVVEFIVAAAHWVGSISFVAAFVQTTVVYWKWFWSSTLVYVLQLILPVSWFQWIASSYLWFLDYFFAMPPEIYRDLFIVSFLLLMPLFRATEAYEDDVLIPRHEWDFLIAAPLFAVVLSLPLLGLPIAALVVLFSLIDDFGLVIIYLFHVGLMVGAAGGYYALNAQL